MDEQYDSPGFSAKYGIYSFMYQQSNKIIDFTLTNVYSVANSAVIEKIGFAELLEQIEKTYGSKIRSKTTDRHIQIWAFLEKVLPVIPDKLPRKLAKLAEYPNSINYFWWWCWACQDDQKLHKE